jgi:hypothetical protein
MAHKKTRFGSGGDISDITEGEDYEPDTGTSATTVVQGKKPMLKPKPMPKPKPKMPIYKDSVPVDEPVTKMAKGGSASSRADGIAQRGKTRGKMC